MPRRRILDDQNQSQAPSDVQPQSSDPLPSDTTQPLTIIRQNWKWGAISQFLFVFSRMLRLESLQLDDLEADLIEGTTRFIPSIMQKLLHSLTLDRKITTDNWMHHLRRQHQRRDPDNEVLGTEDETIEWSSLSMEDRVNVLHSLCEWQFHNPNRLRTQMNEDDHYAHWRQEPIGWDSKRNAYWLFGGERLWVQHPHPSTLRSHGVKRKKPPTKAQNTRESKRPAPARGPATRATRSRSQPSKPPAAKAKTRATGTRVSSRLRGTADDEWQQIPDEWLEDAKTSDQKTKGKGKPDLKTRPKRSNALSLDDDTSDLTELSDEEPDTDVASERAHESSDHDEPEEEPADEEEEEEREPPNDHPPDEDTQFIEWETICVSISEWQSLVATRFPNSTYPKEKALVKLLREHIVPEVVALLQAREQELRKVEMVFERKRSSRIAMRESEKESQRLAAKAREEQDLRTARERRGQERARDRETRMREREERLLQEAAALSEPDIAEAPSVEQAGPEAEQPTNGTVSKADDKSTKVTSSQPRSRSQTPSDDDWFLDCEICGKSGWNIDDGSDVTQCEKCHKWQHVACHDKLDVQAGRAKRNWADVDFLCQACQQKKPRTSFRSTLPNTEPYMRGTSSMALPLSATLPPQARSSYDRQLYYPPSMTAAHGYGVPNITNGTNGTYQHPPIPENGMSWQQLPALTPDSGYQTQRPQQWAPHYQPSHPALGVTNGYPHNRAPIPGVYGPQHPSTALPTSYPQVHRQQPSHWSTKAHSQAGNGQTYVPPGYPPLGISAPQPYNPLPQPAAHQVDPYLSYYNPTAHNQSLQ